MKNKHGITLIALIITIIIMLIMVAVTINVTLNGRTLENAEKASKNTEKHSIYEQIISMSEFNSSGELDVEKTFAKIQQQFGNKVSSLGADGTFAVEGKYGTYTYKMTVKEISIVGDENNKVSYKAYSDGDAMFLIDLDDNVYLFEDGILSENGVVLLIEEYTIPEIETSLGGTNYVSNGVLELDTTTKYKTICMENNRKFAAFSIIL